MVIETIKEYFKNFRYIILLLLVMTVCDTLFYHTGIYTKSNNVFIVKSNAANYNRSDILNSFKSIIAYLFSTVVFFSYFDLIIKKVFNGENVEILASIKESTKYYFRHFRILLIIGAMVIGLVIGGSIVAIVPIFGIILFILIIVYLVYLLMKYIPCPEYMIYNDCSLEEALNGGKAAGKKYFWSILMVCLVTNFISKVVLVYNKGAIILFFTIFIENVLISIAYAYRMRIVKEYTEKYEI